MIIVRCGTGQYERCFEKMLRLIAMLTKRLWGEILTCSHVIYDTAEARVESCFLWGEKNRKGFI